MVSKLYDRIVADGGAGWWHSPEGVETRRRIELDVRTRYGAKLAGAGWFKEILLQIRMRREIRAETERAVHEILWVSGPPR